MQQAVFAADEPIVIQCEAGSYEVENTRTVNLYEKLPEGTEVVSIEKFSLLNELSSYTPTYSQYEAKLTFVTRICDDPKSINIPVTVLTSNGEVSFLIKMELTGPYTVEISGVRHNDGVKADGAAHKGYLGTPAGKLKSGTEYNGEFVFTYVNKLTGETVSEVTEPGEYIVTIAPADSEQYKGSKSLWFKVIENDQAAWQTEASGDWKTGSFTEAVYSVYDGGTVKLLADVPLYQQEMLDKSFTLTSSNTASPAVITRSEGNAAYLLVINKNIKFENIVIDGNGDKSITSNRALIAVNGGTLTLADGAAVKNNNNTLEESRGGGVCTLSGELVLDGGTISGNTAAYGGGVYMSGGKLTAKRGTVGENEATSVGGGICTLDTSKAEMNITGSVKITENKAKAYAGGINCHKGQALYISGNPIISGNSSNEEGTDGGVYVDGYSGEFGYVRLGALTEGADVKFYTYAGKEGFVVASPTENYTLTDSDLDKIGYLGGKYSLVKNDAGKIELKTIVDVVTQYKAAASGAQGTTATGFLTTITPKAETKLDSVKWTVTSGGVTKSMTADGFNLTASGETVIGLIINNLMDENATATAVING